ncbi:sister chromatid cohesion protein dcc1-related [Holotrichia oblita]|uniref:Sister chromatid cohesion protein dcc1-related n=1 Tax=Holotrichia oblita TaxID=644536 RepID=A0ACB9TLE9_HOLOL|nr:sister chromatid cohesion protein dcc1-related [Holotrichia oblita]
MTEESLDSKRTVENINKILSLAKLTETDLYSTSQTIYFTENTFHHGQYKLLELDKYLVQALKEGETLYIKGDDEENAVLCTKSKTYDVLETETSNSLLLFKDLQFCDSLKTSSERNISKIKISTVFHDYLEVLPSKPHLKKLKDLLKKSIYKGPEHEYEVNEESLLTYNSMLNTIQTSEEELKVALKTLNTITINDKIRILDFEYHFRVLSYMLKLIDENSWQLDEIDYEETMNALNDLIPTNVLNNIFDLYAEESKVIDGLQLFRYNEEKVCKFFAQVLLSSAGKFNLNEFLQAWKESVPEGMIATESMLHGIAIVDRKSAPNVIWAFEEKDLPETINERFQVLFEAKEKWTVEEISPYIQLSISLYCKFFKW